ncbi:diguanylate cyclase [bacterium]|nr:diguanylate cyclase [bacterium]
MPHGTWIKESPVSVTVCDAHGIILEMNDKAAATFQKDGGSALVGTNVLDCHPEPSKSQLKEMLKAQSTNCYTIESGGKRKLIYQVPWYENREYRGLVELSFEIPSEMPHFIR